VQARSLQSGGVLVLTQPVSTARAGVGESGFLTRLLIALLIGLALAVIAGLLLARRLGRPLQKASAAAHVLASGSRDVRLEPEGPAELAELAESLNGLAEALDTSEGRQREFLLSVSHELRTPLTAVQGYAEALADGVVADDDASATGAVMLAEARRLDRLVSDLLDLARTGARDLRLDVAPLDAVDLVSDAGRVWSDRTAREDVELSVRVPELPVPVVTDATRLRQIIDNLAENALRVSPSGSTMVFGLRREGGDAVIEVRDSGPGLTDDDLAVAFQPGALYERYRGVRRVGSGVGLALVDALVRRLGGSVEAANADTGGAVFRVRVPARD
jgi:two-component system sensor histidine kinase BaeS